MVKLRDFNIAQFKIKQGPVIFVRHCIIFWWAYILILSMLNLFIFYFGKYKIILVELLFAIFTSNNKDKLLIFCCRIIIFYFITWKFLMVIELIYHARILNVVHIYFINHRWLPHYYKYLIIFFLLTYIVI
jgi:hypothetical protein